MKIGLPVVVSAPSGGGKSTIVSEALKKRPGAVRSISCTTRPPRSGEKNGHDYYFLSEREFKTRIKNKQFLEWARVHGHLYGTPIGPFRRHLRQGRDVFLAIDPKGALSIRKFFPHGIFIFVTPPTWSLLLKRLKNRGTDSPGALKIRLENARSELKMIRHYDYLVLNKRLNRAVDDVLAILRSEHRRIRNVSWREASIFK